MRWIAATIVLDYALHRAGLVWIGRYLGPVGTGLIVVSFVYSLRKRRNRSTSARPASVFGKAVNARGLATTISFVRARVIVTFSRFPE